MAGVRVVIRSDVFRLWRSCPDPLVKAHAACAYLKIEQYGADRVYT